MGVEAEVEVGIVGEVVVVAVGDLEALRRDWERNGESSGMVINHVELGCGGVAPDIAASAPDAGWAGAGVEGVGSHPSGRRDWGVVVVVVVSLLADDSSHGWALEAPEEGPEDPMVEPWHPTEGRGDRPHRQLGTSADVHLAAEGRYSDSACQSTARCGVAAVLL